jgi:hypothetical protein
MPSAAALKSKQVYNDKLCKLLDEHERAFLVHADNVGSRQFMDIRSVRLIPADPPIPTTRPSLPCFFRVLEPAGRPPTALTPR